MTNTFTFKIPALFLLLFSISSFAQEGEITSGSDLLNTYAVPERTVYYDVSDEGISLPITWGLDLAWLSAENIRRGKTFMGEETVDIIRSSFMPTDALVNDSELQGDAYTNTVSRINIIKNNFGTDITVGLNSDHPSVHADFYQNAVNWANLIDITRKMHEDAGLNVVSVSPFNEPDYWQTGQGTIDDFYNIVVELRKRVAYNNIRISGGNTLNCDEATYWYNYLKPAGINEGNTHQLAGVFDNYASFFQTVSGNGDYATADELHNVMEAIVGAEYGMQAGIWWGTAEYARGEFCKITDGVRLGYAEHRDNWTAAAVYRGTDGGVKAFCGESERQSVTTTYRYVSTDRDVYYDGQGPQREFILEMPGGEPDTYQTELHPNAESVINITWGDDIQPVINGTYAIINRNSGKAMEVAYGSSANGANIYQRTYNTNQLKYQQWNVTPVSNRIGGDFSYFSLINVYTQKSPDVYNWSLDNNGDIRQYDDAKGSNQQWYLQYAGDGYFYIRSRWSGKCLEIANASTADQGNVQQYDLDGGTNQQWRFVPIGADVEFTAPVAPQGLTATPQPESIRLDWTANTEEDLSGYTILRKAEGESYNTIARAVPTTTFIDNNAKSGIQYTYAIKATDNSVNTSEISTEVSAIATGEQGLVAHLMFEGNTRDSSINTNNVVATSSLSYTDGKIGDKAAYFNGTNTYLNAPATIANYNALSISTWVYCSPYKANQHIVDFSNGTEECITLTPNNNLVNGKLQFTMKHNGVTETLETTKLTFSKWYHVAVTIDGSAVRLYVDGELKAENTSASINPMDIKPALNYIGRSQDDSDPFFKGNLDDFKIFNYALSGEEVARIADPSTDANDILDASTELKLYPNPASHLLYVSYNTKANATLSIYDMNGKMVLNQNLISAQSSVTVSDLEAGVYMAKFESAGQSTIQKLIIK